MDFITFRCTSCNHNMKVGADKAGRKAKCPKCQTELAIPKAEAVTPGAAPAKPVDDDDEYAIGGSYGVLVDKELEEKKRLALEAEQNKKKDKKKPAPRLEIKKKELKDKKKWLLVRRSLLLFMIGFGTLALAALLPVLVVVIGFFSTSDYPAIADKVLLEEMPPVPPPGFVQRIDPVGFGLGVIAGDDSADLARGLHIFAQVLVLAAGGLFLTGYILALPVPDRYGTAGQVKALIGINAVNLILTLAFRLLPLLGVYGGLLPLLTPEMSMVDGNIERSVPLHIFWSFSGFWAEFLSVVILFVQYLEPILLGVFLWSIGQSMKDDQLEESGLGLAKMGFGILFILVAFHIVSTCGCSEVLVWLLRIVYVLFIGFTAGWITRYILVLLYTRDLFDKRIFGEVYTDEEEEKDDEDDDDDDD